MEKEVEYKVLPNDVLAEQATLGAMLQDRESVIEAMELLSEKDFYREDNREIFAAMSDLFTAGKNIDIITVNEQLLLRSSLEKVGGMAYLSNLTDSVPSTSNIVSYITIVHQKAILRNLIKVANDIIKMGYSQSQDVDTVIEETEKRIFEVLQNKNSKDFISIKEILFTIFGDLEKRVQNKSKLSGIPSGFIDLDAKISGLNNSDLIILAARPAMGKSALAINIATHVAKQNVPALIFSLEMSKEQMISRILASEGNVNSMNIKNADLTSDDWVKLSSASSKVSDMPLYVDDTPGLNPTELRAKCRKAKLEKNIGLIVIDHMQLMETKIRSASRQQEITEISRSLKILAKELNVPVIALSQLSRGNEARNDKRPMLSDLRESGSIEQDADIVLFIHREDYYNPDTEKKNIAEIIISKNRSGSTGIVELAWRGELTKFENLYKGKVEE